MNKPPDEPADARAPVDPAAVTGPGDPDATLVAAGGGPTTLVRDPDATQVTDRAGAARQPDQAADQDPLLGRRLLNRYRITRKIGSGGFGSVYRAVDELKEQGGERNEIAIKTLDLDVSSNRLSGLIQEVSRSHTVSHPNIMRVYDIHLDGDLAFITMELLVGQALEDRLKSQGRLAEKEVDRIAETMCAALAYCHDQNLVHSDIKPANIFMCDDGQIKLLDLGIAQMVGSVNQIAGYSPRYASPEQVANQPPDGRDDLFSLACVLYEALTGEHPFGRQLPIQAMQAGFQPDLSRLTRRYRRAIGAGLAYARDQRPATGRKLWGRINPAVRKRFLAAAGLAAMALIGFVVSNRVGEEVGKAAISVSEADQAYAQERYEAALRALATNRSDGRAALVEALQRNPYLEEAAEALVVQLRAANPADPSQFSMVWSDYVAAITASPTSDALTEFTAEATEQVLASDTDSMSRLEVLSRLRVPVCALSSTGYRKEELDRKSVEASISC